MNREVVCSHLKPGSLQVPKTSPTLTPSGDKRINPSGPDGTTESPSSSLVTPIASVEWNSLISQEKNQLHTKVPYRKVLTP